MAATNANKKNKVDTSTMSPEDKAAYEKRLEAARSPKPAYLGYTVNEDGSLNISVATRSAEEVLKAVDQNKELKYQRFMIK